MLGNAALAREKLTALALVRIKPRQDPDAPPSGIIRRALLFGSVEIVPRMIGRRGIASGQTVSAEFVEISAVASRVVENAVEDDLHPPLVRGFDECSESLLTAEFIRDLHIIRGIVFVIADGIEDGGKIEHAHAERLEIIELFDDSPKIAAEEVVVLDLRAAIFGILRHSVFPIGIEDRIRAVKGVAFALGKSIKKNVVHHTAAEPLGYLKIGAVDGKSEFVPILLDQSEADVIRGACGKLLLASAENICIVKKPRIRLSAERGCVEAQLVFIVNIIGRNKFKADPLHRRVLIIVAGCEGISAYTELGGGYSERSRNPRRDLDNASSLERAESGNVLAPAPFFDAGSVLHIVCNHILLLDGVNIPDIICVFLYRAVCGEEAALCNIDERTASPILAVQIVLIHLFVCHTVGIKVRKARIGVCYSVTCKQIGRDIREGFARKARVQAVNDAAKLIVSRIEERGIVAREPEVVNLACCQTEDVDILVADSGSHFDVRAVESTDGERAVEHKLHTARTARLFTRKRDLLADLGGGDEAFSRAHAVILKEEHAELFVDAGILLDLLAKLADELNDSLRHLISGSSLRAEDVGSGIELTVRVVADIKIVADDVEHVEKLALILVQTLDLNVEYGVGVKTLSGTVFNEFRERDLIFVLDAAKSVEDCGIVFVFHKLRKLNGVLAVARADGFVKQGCKSGR